jgi:hypothetical protein
MSVRKITLLDTGASTAATGNWVQTNQRFSHVEQIVIYSSCVGNTAGDYYLEASPAGSDDLAVCVAPFTPADTKIFTQLGYFPYVRAVKKVNSPGCKIVLVDL